jgi:hypothetical protein
MDVDYIEGEPQSSADDAGKIIQILGVIILVFGLLVAVIQTSFISNQVTFIDQAPLLGDLCWIAAGMAIELLGIGLIILGKRR